MDFLTKKYLRLTALGLGFKRKNTEKERLYPLLSLNSPFSFNLSPVVIVAKI
jgi:hypothetical protein